MKEHEGYFFVDGPRNCKPQSSHEDDTPSPNYYTNERILSLDKFNVHEPPLHGVSSMAPGLEPSKRWSRIRDHNC
ncbi:hypothetical protein TNCV_2654551 [Trichonephila clavipes]|nr:hypothetical protein TNCV_2654551 [Trichonephila clavipes]